MKNQAAIGVLIAVIAISITGCATGARLVAKNPADVSARQGPAAPELLTQATVAKFEGRYEHAAEAFEALARQTPVPPPKMAILAYAEAAACWLAAGNNDRFQQATDALWEGAGEFGRRDLGADEIALIGLADRMRGREPRVPIRMLPPEVRATLESQPVPQWQLLNSNSNE